MRGGGCKIQAGNQGDTCFEIEQATFTLGYFLQMTL